MITAFGNLCIAAGNRIGQFAADVYITGSIAKDAFVEKAAKNRAQLRRGTVLDPLDHPSYSADKVAALRDLATNRDASIQRALTRYENAAAAL